MNFTFLFFLNSILLGVGLAMDAFSVSLANGLNESDMKIRKMCGIAGVFGIFQALMPMTGWICVHTVVEHFSAFEKFTPWIALVLLMYIGGKMLIDGIKSNNSEESAGKILGFTALLIQGVATSIDALSVGFTIADYDFVTALVCSLVIAIVTFFISMGGIVLGKKFGMIFSNKAQIMGGIILILIGLEIFINGIID